VRDFISRALNVLWPSSVGLRSLGNERQNLEALRRAGDELARCSPFADVDHRDFVVSMMRDACRDHGREPHRDIQIAICITLDDLMVAEGIIAPDIDWKLLDTSFSYQDLVRTRLDSRKHFFTEYERNMEIWRRKMVVIFAGLLGYFPDHAFRDRVDGPQFKIALTDAVVELPEALDRLLITYGDEDFRYPDLSREVRKQLIDNLLRASGIDPQGRGDARNRLVMPTDADSGNKLVPTYLHDTPYEGFLTGSVPFAIPESARYEHTMILGGTGHGKTQLMQQLLLADLERAQVERRSIVVIDSQGDLIRKVSGLRLFGKHEDTSLFHKFCLIDPTDIDNPVALNMFAVNQDRLATYGKAEREKVLNGTVELYENFFGSLLGAELTQKQGVIFRYLARLMLEIPNANIHTLRDLMDDAEPFIPYMEKLTGSARYFFEREFFDRSFGPTKKQIAKRLWGVLATPSFERMFAQKENKIDMFDLLNRGSVILINTAKDLLKQEGCELFGRFFLSMITQAAMERSVIAERERTPTTVYVDEAQEYFDDSIDVLLAQGRKYRIGLVCGNQTLDQLTPSLRASFMSNTGTKVVGGLSSKDAHAFGSEMRTDAEFLQSLKKREKVTEFALYVRHHTPQALRIEVPLGLLEQEDTLTELEYEELLERSRIKYAADELPEEQLPQPFKRLAAPEKQSPRVIATHKVASDPLTDDEVVGKHGEIAEITPTPGNPSPRVPITPWPIGPRKPALPSTPGRGGRQHKYLQELVKGLAEQHGFRARIEEEVLGGDGFVDVSLTRGDERIACEIAITTPVEKEVQNIRKCLDAGYQLVWVISPEAQHLSAIRRLAEEILGERLASSSFIREDELAAIFAERAAPQRDSIVRGYRVRVNKISSPQTQERQKREAIASVLTRTQTR
jgi:hypothetical protein